MANNDYRDKVEIKSKIEYNKRCVDCDSKNPRWTSLKYGCFICIECAGIHRSIGVKYDFVKSVSLDKWSLEEYSVIKYGGNKNFKDYLTDNYTNRKREINEDERSQNFTDSTESDCLNICDKYTSVKVLKYSEILMDKIFKKTGIKITPAASYKSTKKDDFNTEDFNREDFNSKKDYSSSKKDDFNTENFNREDFNSKKDYSSSKKDYSSSKKDYSSSKKDYCSSSSFVDKNFSTIAKGYIDSKNIKNISSSIKDSISDLSPQMSDLSLSIYNKASNTSQTLSKSLYSHSKKLGNATISIGSKVVDDLKGLYQKIKQGEINSTRSDNSDHSDNSDNGSYAKRAEYQHSESNKFNKDDWD